MKRGTGLPQLLASVLIVLIGMFLLATVFFFRAGDAPVTENVDSELANLTAYYVLNGFLNQKVEIDDFYLDDPRVRDVIIAFEGLSEEEAAFNEKLSLGLQAYNEVPDLFTSLEFTEFAFFIDGTEVKRTSDFIGGFEFANCDSVGQSTATLAKKAINSPIRESIEVKLVICEDSR